MRGSGVRIPQAAPFSPFIVGILARWAKCSGLSACRSEIAGFLFVCARQSAGAIGKKFPLPTFAIGIWLVSTKASWPSIPATQRFEDRLVTDDQSRDKRFAVAVVDAVPPEHHLALKAWADQLLIIANSPAPRWQKAKKAMRATQVSEVIWPALKTVAKQIKRAGWDTRSGPAKAFVSVAAVSAAVFGGKAAGVAALGTAVGVPLWIVFGAGAWFAKAVADEVTRKSAPAKGATYTVIDADRRDV